MKSGTRLDSAVFQLTPTRTRYELVIIANGKTEKIASGLLNPFLAHLKTAQDQIAKGGYSITLEPDSGSEAEWFTKGTVERFIRFVSTPEVLERVNTIESEILQIGEAIVIQGNENMGLSIVEEHQKKVEDRPSRPSETIEGNRSLPDANSEKAIVLYKPEAHPPESNGSSVHEETSRVQLLRVLETRKTVLQKEQGMAFARATAAGFDMDHMSHLILFAERFGASRLMDACFKFIDLWKAKHESGQWLEIEASEAIPTRSDFSSLNVGIETGKQKNENPGEDSNSDNVRDKMPPMDPQVPLGQGQFQHPMFPHWPMHSPPGAPPVFQPYPMQGIPYYNYPGAGPFFQQPYPSMEDPRYNTPQRMGRKRHSMDSRDSNTELDHSDAGDSNRRSSDDSELEKEGSHSKHSHRKAGQSGKKKSGMVVIRNINYITSKKQDKSNSESESDSNSEIDEEADASDVKHKKSAKFSKNEESGITNEQAADGGNWQAFQNCLLRNDNKNSRSNDRDMFSGEREGQIKKRMHGAGQDPLVYGQDYGQTLEDRRIEFDAITGQRTLMLNKGSDEGRLISQGEFTRESEDGQMRVRNDEFGGRGRYKRGDSEDLMIYRDVHSSLMRSQSVPQDVDEYGQSINNREGSSSYNISDESFIVPRRSSSQDQYGNQGIAAIDLGNELPSGNQKTEDSSSRNRIQLNYEPDDLSLVPQRGNERESVGYDPALDYEMQGHTIVRQGTNREGAVTSSEEVKQINKVKKSKPVPGSLEKRRIEAAMRKGNASKLTPGSEAQARADRLRAFKADLQKMKREKDEEDRKRLEALKIERQKRITARGSSQSTVPSQVKPRQTTKISPSSHKPSKFSDSPGPLSPLQRLPIRTSSVGSGNSQKTTNSSKLNNNSRLVNNGLSRSVSSLPDKKETRLTPEPKVAARQVRRLSEPRTTKANQASFVKSQRTVPSPKPRVHEIKKISEITSLDKSKAATLPELKIKTPKASPSVVRHTQMENEMKQKADGNRSSITSTSSKEKITHDNNIDENPVVEKNVVILEKEMHSLPVLQEPIVMRKASVDSEKVGNKTEVVSESTALPLTRGEAVRGISESNNNPQVNLVSADAEKELTTFSNLSIGEKPYQAPYARMSSLEDPCTTNSEYTKATPNSDTLATITETQKATVSGFTDMSSTEQILESSEKHHGKESSKGLRRFLKLGKKNHSSSTDRHVDSDKMSTDGSLADNGSDEVHTLKNLISQSETPTGSTPQKASRHFSLLSPFRKSSEKKSSS